MMWFPSVVMSCSRKELLFSFSNPATVIIILLSLPLRKTKAHGSVTKKNLKGIDDRELFEGMETFGVRNAILYIRHTSSDVWLEHLY